MWIILWLSLFNFNPSSNNEKSITVYETSKSGHQLTVVNPFVNTKDATSIIVDLNREKQTITGFGGAFTEASACLLYTSPSPRDLSTSRMPSSA